MSSSTNTHDPNKGTPLVNEKRPRPAPGAMCLQGKIFWAECDHVYADIDIVPCNARFASSTNSCPCLVGEGLWRWKSNVRQITNEGQSKCDECLKQEAKDKKSKK